MTATHVDPEEVMAWVDGELGVSQAQEIEAHVAECVECAAVAAGFRRMSGELAEWKVEEIPERVEAAVMRAAATGEKGVFPRQTASDMGHPRRRGVRWMRWGMGLGAVAAVMVLLVISPWSRGHQAGTVFYQYQQRTASEPSPNVKWKLPESKTQLDGVDAKLAPAPPPATLEARMAPMQAVSAVDEGVSEGATQKRDRFSGGGLEQLAEPAAGARTTVINGSAFNADTASTPATPMIARTVSLSVRVKDVVGARAAVEALLARHRGYAAQMNANTAEGAARVFTASLRIPAPELGAALRELRGLGRVDNESQSGEEVTAQHEDLVARLKNARETESRMQAILEQRTGRISDVLEVEQEIARVRGEIESMEAEQAGLEHRVQFATVELTLAEEYKAQFAAPDSVGTRLRNAFVAGLRSAWETVLGMVLFVEEFGPAMLVWALLLAVPVLLLWRRYRRMLETGARG